MVGLWCFGFVVLGFVLWCWFCGDCGFGGGGVGFEVLCVCGVDLVFICSWLLVARFLRFLVLGCYNTILMLCWGAWIGLSSWLVRYVGLCGLSAYGFCGNRCRGFVFAVCLCLFRLIAAWFWAV